MAMVQVRNFGGELPATSPRALPADAAQVNRDLLATTTEFRPLLGDKNVGAAPSGALTLHRMSRRADGTLRTGDAEGWVAELADKNYVRGQLNDDSTERTAVCWNDGTQPPRAIDARGADRLLGVPAPVAPTVALATGTYFGADQAQNWLDAELVPALVAALKDSLLLDATASRHDGTKPVAGATSFHGLAPVADRPALLYKALLHSTAEARGLLAPELGGWFIPGAGIVGDQWAVGIAASPYWGRVVDITGLQNRLRLIESPRTGSQMFDETQIGEMATTMAALFDPEGDALKPRREQLDAAVLALIEAMDNTGGQRTPRPEEPAKPTGPQYQWGGWKSSEYVRTPAWQAYDAAYAQWRKDMDAWLRNEGDAQVNQAGIVAAAAEARGKAQRLFDEIEAEYTRRLGRIEALVRDAVGSQGFISAAGGGGLIEVDADPIVDPRYYIMTWVDDWGRESAPCPVSDMLEVNQYDSVTVTRPAVPAGRFIEKWRLYRSNVGSASAAFQFVDDFMVGTASFVDTVPADRLGEVCPTMAWAEPPYRLDNDSVVEPRPPKGADPYLRGLVAMPNGIVAGFVDNFVAFCHPYHPYAWPVEYQITTEHPIVGLAVFGQTLFVGTMGHPSFITGADSASMSEDKRPEFQPCASRASIAPAVGGVLYASPNGICLASPAGVQVLTDGLFAVEDWQAMDPSSVRGVVFGEAYYFWASGQCWVFDFKARKLGRVSGLDDVTATATDVLTDGLFAVAGTNILRLFAQGRRTGRWRTPLMVMQRPVPFGWVVVEGDQGPGAPVTLRWFADGALRHTMQVTDIEPRRLPPGRWLEHEVEIESEARVTRVAMAGSTRELQAS